MNEIWRDPGRKCPYCPCFFQCSDDLNSHLKAFGCFPHSVKRVKGATNSLLPRDLDLMEWRDSGNGPYCGVELNPTLFRVLLSRGKIRIGFSDYSLSKNRKWIQKKVCKQ